MALYTTDSVRACIRNRDGRRVFYLGPEDRLTDAARDYLREENIPILPAGQAKPSHYRTLFGGEMTEKPEHMTHLNSNLLVFKNHPRIRFRGKIDALEAEILLAQHTAQMEGYSRLCAHLGEVLDYVRHIIRCDVMEEPLGEIRLCGLSEQELREQSHNPAKFYDQPHFMPDHTMKETMLLLNRTRTLVRETELDCYEAFRDMDGNPSRPDLLLGLNRLSSLLWILMIRLKSGYYERK